MGENKIYIVMIQPIDKVIKIETYHSENEGTVEYRCLTKVASHHISRFNGTLDEVKKYIGEILKDNVDYQCSDILIYELDTLTNKLYGVETIVYPRNKIPKDRIIFQELGLWKN